MNDTTHWEGSYDLEIATSPEAVWGLFRDVAGWKGWNAGIETITLHGPFAAGTEFTMQPPGQDAFTSRLLEVVENDRFVDETVVGDLRVVVTHRIEKLGAGRVRVVYAVDARGPGAAEIGPMVSADFPDVLRGLARAAT